MTMKEIIRREAYVVAHGQSARFRIIKYYVLLALFVPLWLVAGATIALRILLALVVLGTCVHFLFRWKTKAWTKSWGPYKKLDLPK